MADKPSNETKELLQHALEFYFHGELDRKLPPRYGTVEVKIAEDWLEEQETSEEERIRFDKENGERMKQIILGALSSHEYRVLDEEVNSTNEEYETLRMAQIWIENLVPGKDIA